MRALVSEESRSWFATAVGWVDAGRDGLQWKKSMQTCRGNGWAAAKLFHSMQQRSAGMGRDFGNTYLSHLNSKQQENINDVSRLRTMRCNATRKQLESHDARERRTRMHFHRKAKAKAQMSLRSRAPLTTCCSAARCEPPSVEAASISGSSRRNNLISNCQSICLDQNYVLRELRAVLERCLG